MSYAKAAVCFALCIIALPSVAQEGGSSNETTDLQAQISLLQAKLNVAEQTIKLLEKELESVKSKERAKGKDASPDSDEDTFRPGVVWVGQAKGGPDGKVGKWALSISERDGNKFSGAVALVNPDGKKAEFPVSGTAPSSGNGPVTIESPLIGRAKLFMRGRMSNGEIALAVSGVTPLGDKFFASATLRPAN